MRKYQFIIEMMNQQDPKTFKFMDLDQKIE